MSDSNLLGTNLAPIILPQLSYRDSNSISQNISQDITHELFILNHNSSAKLSYLELSCKINPIIDLMGKNSAETIAKLTPKIISLNGNNIEPSHIQVTDLVGNKYEVLLNNEGGFDLPKEGLGLFSYPDYITYLYSAEDVLNSSNPDHNIVLSFADIVYRETNLDLAVSIYDSNNQRLVASVRKVDLLSDKPNIDEYSDNFLNDWIAKCSDSANGEHGYNNIMLYPEAGDLAYAKYASNFAASNLAQSSDAAPLAFQDLFVDDSSLNLDNQNNENNDNNGYLHSNNSNYANYSPNLSDPLSGMGSNNSEFDNSGF